MEGRIWNDPGTTGSIKTFGLDDVGTIFFGGDLVGEPVEGFPTNPGPVDPSEAHCLWVHMWHYVIPFSAPVIDSTFTYSFDVNVQAALLIVVDPASLYSRVTIGETANYTGRQLLVTATVGWPLDGVELSSTSGVVRGQQRVHRSFFVRAGHRPAVLLVVGIWAVLDPPSEVIFEELASFITPTSSTGVGNGLVHFRYDPFLVAQQ